jgi:hypothetical protein
LSTKVHLSGYLLRHDLTMLSSGSCLKIYSTLVVLVVRIAHDDLTLDQARCLTFISLPYLF